MTDVGGSGRSLDDRADAPISPSHATLRGLVCIRMLFLLVHLFEVESQWLMCCGLQRGAGGAARAAVQFEFECLSVSLPADPPPVPLVPSRCPCRHVERRAQPVRAITRTRRPSGIVQPAPTRALADASRRADSGSRRSSNSRSIISRSDSRIHSASACISTPRAWHRGSRCVHGQHAAAAQRGSGTSAGSGGSSAAASAAGPAVASSRRQACTRLIRRAVRQRPVRAASDCAAGAADGGPTMVEAGGSGGTEADATRSRAEAVGAAGADSGGGRGWR